MDRFKNMFSENNLVSLWEGLLGHDVIEVLWGNLSVRIAVCAFNHFHQLFISHGLAKFLGDTTKVLDCNGACFIVIEQSKDLVDIFFSVFV